MDRLESIAVVGAGSWGTALAGVVAQTTRRVVLWGHREEHVARLRETRRNEEYLPSLTLAPAIEPTHDLALAAECDALLLVTPSSAMREVATALAAAGLRKDAPLISCTKGIERGTGLRMSEIVQSIAPENPVGVLSGPSHAEEVALQRPTALVLGCAESAVSARLQQVVGGPYLRTYTSEDVAGIELGGALKNIFAIGAGVSDGLGLGDNSKAALVTRALAEMTRLGCELGGRRETFQGLSGIGDLMVTCFSRHSRNRGVGERLGRGETLEQIQSSMHMIAEGVPTTRSVRELVEARHVRAPIIEQVWSVLYEGKAPAEAMIELLSRDPRPEAD